MRLERLCDRHATRAFRCGVEDLDRWLHEAAPTADRAGTARVYVWTGDGRAVAGYVAIVPHVVRRDAVPPSLGRGAPEVLPGFLLARLALHEDLHGAGRGGELLVRGLAAVLDAIRVGGGRVIVVDAIDDRAARFYEHFGFRSIPANAARLVMKASTAAASLGVAWP